LEAAAHRAAAQSPDEAQFEADLLDLVADELSYYDRQEEAETMERNALMIRKRLFGDQNLDVAQSLNFLSIVLLRQSSEVAVSVKQSKQAESERLARESLAIRRRLLGEQHLDVAASLESVGKVRQALGDLAEAESLGRQALEIRKRLVNDADGVADGMISLADTLNDERKFPEAEELYRQGLAKLKATWGEDHPWVAYAISHLATCVQRQGRLAEAELLYRQALAMSKKSFDEKHPDVVGTTSALADVLRDEGKLAEAEEQFREVLRVRSKYLGATNPATGRARDNLADILKRQGKQAEAKALIEAQSTPTSE
jgi:tetratricopeptide (TPR) repeat protein